jgi:hypothetical protein
MRNAELLDLARATYSIELHVRAVESQELHVERFLAAHRELTGRLDAAAEYGDEPVAYSARVHPAPNAVSTASQPATSTARRSAIKVSHPSEADDVAAFDADLSARRVLRTFLMVGFGMAFVSFLLGIGGHVGIGFFGTFVGVGIGFLGYVMSFSISGQESTFGPRGSALVAFGCFGLAIVTVLQILLT